jgi:hypothetical protein
MKYEAMEFCLVWEIRIVGSGIYNINQTIVVFFCLKSLLDMRHGPENRVQTKDQQVYIFEHKMTYTVHMHI